MVDSAKIILFLSGQGSNARNIIECFEGQGSPKVVALFSNNPKAGSLAISRDHQIPLEIFDKDAFNNPAYLPYIQAYEPSLIVLAGFLWLIPAYMIAAFPRQIINLHPALLPKYSGKGMYGKHVHEAVSRSGDAQTGITIHRVNEHFDEGEIIASYSCPINPYDPPAIIEEKVRKLEMEYLPIIIEDYLAKMNN